MFKNKLLNGVVFRRNICFIEKEGEPSLQDILQFDPFGGEASSTEAEPPAATADGAAATAAPAQTGEEKPEGVVEDGNVSPPSAAPTQAAPSGEPPKPVSQADLESLIRQQTEVIRAAVQPQQTQQQAAPTAKFQLGVPDALVNALRSEDPKEFSAGVGAMINGVANHVWNAFSEHLEKSVLPMVPQMIQRYAETQQRQENVARDFYGKYPQLQIPELAPVVQTIGAQIAQEFASQGRSLEWGDQLRDAIAERLFSRMPFLKTLPQTNGAAPPARRSFSTGSGARPPAPSSSSENDMMEMIFGPTSRN